jgi:Putative MetA-pathway of phenol degradation
MDRLLHNEHFASFNSLDRNGARTPTRLGCARRWRIRSEPQAIMRRTVAAITSIYLLLGSAPAFAGPPYVTDDPEPTDEGYFEIYAFSNGTMVRDGAGGEAGMDFNYGAAPDLQLTAVIPLGWNAPDAGRSAVSLGNIELAAKYKFFHQDTFGVDVAIFPRVFLPAGSPDVGERHASLLLPVWIGRSWDSWSTFGGGGCVLNHGGGSQNFCQLGWAITNQITPELQLGAEIYHQTADTIGGRPSTGIGIGAIYDVNETYHLMASLGPGIQNTAETNQVSWYVAVLTTF